MTDVFISYSRSDIAFARLLHQALAQHEFETWIDWQDIPPSADWLAEVREAIEHADTFMFVISESSAASEICGLEVAHAVENNKRLIPVVVNKVDPKTVHPALAAINWIFFRDESEFAGAIQALIQAIETDQAWVKQHTRLQVRALEWEGKERESGFMLRGRDLEDAEQWLSLTGTKDALPTTLQTQYIIASRQSATRRQRTTLGAALVAIMMMAALGILAWTQRNQAVHEGEVRATAESIAVAESTRAVNAESTAVAESTRALNAESTAVGERAIAEIESTRAVRAEGVAVAERATAQAESTRAIRAEATAEAERAIAETEAAIARSRQLAANSKGQLDTNHELGLLLAIEARRLADTEEAETALRESFVHRGRTLSLLTGHTGAVLEVAWNGDGTLLVSAGADGTARVWDVSIAPDSGSETELAVLTGHEGEVTHVAWDGEGDRILTAGEDGTVRVWDISAARATAATSHGTEVAVLSGHTGPVGWAAWNGDGTRLLTASEDGTARVWQIPVITDTHVISRGQEVLVLSGHTGKVHNAAWNRDETLIVTAGSDSTARVWDAETGQELGVLPADMFGTRYAAWNEDGTRIVTTESGEAQMWDLAQVLAAGVQGAQASALTQYQHAVPAYLIGSVVHASWSPNEAFILSVSDNGTAELWEPESGRPVAFLIGHTGAVNNGAWDGEGSRVLTASDDGTARVWDTASGTELAILSGHTGAVNHAAWNRDSTRVATASSDGTVRVWTVEAIEETAALFCSVQERSEWSPDGRVIVTSGYGPYVWDPESGAELATPGDGYAALNAAGTLLVTGYEEDQAAVWDVSELLCPEQTERSERSESSEPKLVLPFGANATWSGDGTHLLTTSSDGAAHLWDISATLDAGAENGAERAVLEGSGERINHVAWSPDGAHLITIDEGDVMRLWDLSTVLDRGGLSPGAEQATLEGQFDDARYAAWSPDGDRLVVADSTGEARVWDISTGPGTGAVLSGHAGMVNHAAWNPAGARIVTVSADNARVWDAETGAELAVLSGHAGSVHYGAWNSDGTIIATGGWDATARIWDAENGTELAVIGGYFDTVRHAAWSPEGTRVVLTSWGGPARVFEVPLVNMLETACSRAVRNASEAEWEQFMGEAPYRDTCPGKPRPGHDYGVGAN